MDFPSLPSDRGGTTTGNIQSPLQTHQNGRIQKPWNQTLSLVGRNASKSVNWSFACRDDNAVSSGEDQLPEETQRNLRLLSQVLASAPNVPLLIERIWKMINLHLSIKNGH